MHPILSFLTILVFLPCLGCTFSKSNYWKSTVNHQVHQLGYRNWIVISEASYPAHSRPGIKQVIADAEVDEVMDHVLNAIERNQYLRPHIYITREMRSVENDFAPGIETMRAKIHKTLRAYQATELEQESLTTLVQSSNHSFDVLVIRTKTALPYTSVFIELQPGYWDVEAEDRLRKMIRSEKMKKMAHP